jgi:hypothetical protein
MRLPLACLAVALCTPALASALQMSDPIGDTSAGAYLTYDIVSIDAVYDATNLKITIQLTGAPVAPSANQLQGLSGFIDIDADVNPGTGATATIDSLGGGYGNTGLGIEYYVDLFAEAATPGFVDLKDPFMPMNVSSVPIVYGSSYATVTVPLGLLGGSPGLVNYAVAVGDFGNVTDQALDPLVVMMGGLPAQSSPAPVPDPGTALLVGLGLTALGARRAGQRRAVRA